MNDFTFELEPFENDAQRGMRGMVGPFGDVMAFYVKPVRPGNAGAYLRAHLVSEHLPETFVDGVGMGGQPSLTRAVIEVGGVQGTLKYNRLGLRRASRALHITYADREYVYTATRGMGAELSCPGAKVTFRTGEFVSQSRIPSSRIGEGSRGRGRPAIALVFEAVDTDSLSLGTALASAPFRGGNEPVSD